MWNEKKLLPLWLTHYKKQGIFDEDIHILDNNSDEGQLDAALAVNITRFETEYSFQHDAMVKKANEVKNQLLKEYNFVLYVDADEFVFHKRVSLPELVKDSKAEVIRARGFEIIQQQGEPALDWGMPLLRQRSSWKPDSVFSKPCLISSPEYNWTLGFHSVQKQGKPVNPAFDNELLLLHLHKIDLQWCIERHQEKASSNFHPESKKRGLGSQNLMSDPEKIKHWFTQQQSNVEPIPNDIKGIL